MTISFNVNVFCNNGIIFNLSEIDIAEKWLWSDTDYTIITLIIPVLSLIGIIGNGVFSFTILRLQQMKSSLNAYLFNLALCDILFLVAASYWYTTNYLYTPVAYRTIAVDSMWGCAGWVISTHLWYFAGVELNTAITVERYFAICSPLRHRIVVTRKRTIKLLLCIWITSVMISITIVPQYLVFTSYCLIWPNQTKFHLLPRIHTLCNAVNLYFMSYGEIVLSFVYLAALIINSTLYTKIIIALSQRAIARTASVGGSHSQNRIGSESFQSDTIRNQVARTMIANGIVFFVCQTPYRLLSLEYLLDQYGHYGFLDTQQYTLLKSIAYGFIILNSIINPYLYVGSCRYYRNAVKDAFKICK